jgi:hypothetical protein
MDEIGSRALGVLYASGLNAGGCMAGQHVGGEGSPERVRSFNISIERRSVTE